MTQQTGKRPTADNAAPSFDVERQQWTVRPATFDALLLRWRASHTGPDLQELIAFFGRYDRIPPEAWSAWDDEVRDYQFRLRNRGRDL